MLKHLSDLPLEVLEGLVPCMKALFPPATIKGPADIGTEAGRYALAVQCGKHDVVGEFERALHVKKRTLEDR